MAIFNTVYGGTSMVKEYDFTVSDNGFTYNDKNVYASYGWESGQGLRVTGTPAVVGWRGPNDLYTGTLQKIEIDCYSTVDNKACGIAEGRETRFTRAWNGELECNAGGTLSVQAVTLPSGGYKFTIDLVNKEIYISTSPNTKLALSDADITAIQNQWANKIMNIIVGSIGNSSIKGYIRKAKFYYS